MFLLRLEELEPRLALSSHVTVTLNTDGTLLITAPKHGNEKVLVKLSRDGNQILVYAGKSVYRYDPDLVDTVVFVGNTRYFTDLLPSQGAAGVGTDDGPIAPPQPQPPANIANLPFSAPAVQQFVQALLAWEQQVTESTLG
jgi:hypothetical protein